MTSGNLGLRISELQRATNQLEDELEEVAAYPLRTRGAVAVALSDLATRLEVASLAALDRLEAEERSPGATA